LAETIVQAETRNIRGIEPRATKVNWFKGTDPSQWYSDIPTFGAVSLERIYPGIDMVIAATGPTVEKIFTVKPGADPHAIRLSLAGADSLSNAATGELYVHTPAGQVTFTRPVAFQEIGGKRNDVAIAYAIAGDTYGFELGNYDPAYQLTIDPMLSFTYYNDNIGAQDPEEGARAGIIDHEGNIIIVGSTYAVDLPVPGGADDEYNGMEDAYLAKFSPDLDQLLAATYLGGSAVDIPYSVAIDDEGNVFVLGVTQSNDFPTTPNAFDDSYAAGNDGFVAKFDPDLSQLLGATYLGGSQYEYIRAMVFDNDGNVYVGLFTGSDDLPVFPGTFDSDGTIEGIWDLYIAKFSGDLSSLQTATYFGGNNRESLGKMAWGPTGDLYFMGETESSDFPVTAGAYDQTCPGGFNAMDGYVSCISPDLKTLIASTYIGGSGADFPYGLAIDAGGDVYITGHVGETWPTTAGAYDTTYGGSGIFDDACAARLSGDLSTLIASTYIGGSAWDHGVRIMLDEAGDIYIVGNTSSADFPTTPDADDPVYHGNGDVFVAKLNATMTTLQTCTYYGGPGTDHGSMVALSAPGIVYIAGSSEGFDFLLPSGGADRVHDGGLSAFIAKLCFTADCDDDGIANQNDNCPVVVNPDQGDADSDEIGDLCDNCPGEYNPLQEDVDQDGTGDSCEILRSWYVLPDGSGEVATVEIALDSCTHGDTILLGDGIFAVTGDRFLDFRGRRVLLTSEHGPGRTFIDCQGSPGTPRRAFTFDQVDDSAVVVEGLTIRNGYGPLISNASSGGAVACVGASPTFRRCVFTDNEARVGGVVYCAQGSPHFINCAFAANTGRYGSAVFAYDDAHVTLENCVIAFNQTAAPVLCMENSLATSTCGDVYGNAVGDYTGGLAGQLGINGNFSSDPLFCNMGIGDVGLSAAASPCLPENNGCAVLIGALGLECMFPCDCGVWGDLDGSSGVDPIDVTYIVNFVYKNQDGRVHPFNCPFPTGDVNCDNAVNPVDVVYLVNLVYKSQDAFCEPCEE